MQEQIFKPVLVSRHFFFFFSRMLKGILSIRRLQYPLASSVSKSFKAVVCGWGNAI